MKQVQIRTKELDAHWHGYWWCTTCNLYTGQLKFHQGHYVNKIPEINIPCFNCRCVEKSNNFSLVPFIKEE